MTLEGWRRVVFALIFSAAADAGAQDAQPDLTEAKRLYDAAEFQKAVGLLHHAVHALEPQRELETARVQLADAYLHLGLAYCAMGDEEAGKDAFRGLLRLDPARRLDPEIYAPKIIDVFERAGIAVAGEATASFTPAPPATPKPPRSFSIELFSRDALLGKRGYPSEQFPPLDVVRNGYEIRAGDFGHDASGTGERLEAPLPGRWGRLRVEHRSGESSPYYDSFSSSAEFRAAQFVRVESYGLTWSKDHAASRHVVLRRALGYRLFRAEQQVEEFGKDATTTSRYVSSSRVRTHGPHAGLESEIWAGGRWYIDLHAGGSLYLFGTERASRQYDHQTPTGRQSGGSPPQTRNYGPELEWELGAQLRFELGRGLFATVGYDMEHGLDAGRNFDDKRLSGHGTRVGLGLRFGPRRK